MYKIEYNNKSFTLSCHDDFMNLYLTKGLFYEHEMLDYISKLFIRGLYIDIGAYIGNHSIFFSEICENCTGVVSYEPNDENYSILKLNTENYSNKIKIKPVAVGETHGHCEMNIVRSNMGMCNILQTNNGTIPIVTIDDEFKDTTEKIGLIKIDVEGYEYEVLKGAISVIETHRPHMFIESIDNISNIELFLSKFNYENVKCFNKTPTYYFKPMT